jgi:hypothetical protein
MCKPYFYKIKDKQTGKYYVGSQYGKTANKNNFFVSYFTSCRTIKQIVNNHGKDTFEIIKICERDDAREYEAYYLQRCYSLLGKEKFLSLFYNRNLSPGILLDNSIIEKQTATKKSKWAAGIISKPLPPNWKGKFRSDSMKQKLSNSKKGHLVSDETRKKLRDCNLGKKQSKDTVQKRITALKDNDRAFNKKHWLFVSPDKKFYYAIGKRNLHMLELGLALGSNFYNFLNTRQSPTNGKNTGWLFFEGKDLIEQVLKDVDVSSIIRYE